MLTGHFLYVNCQILLTKDQGMQAGKFDPAGDDELKVEGSNRQLLNHLTNENIN